MTRIALVVLDTLRKDAFDEHFDWLDGVRFERAYSTANWTVPAHGSLFTGRYPSETGVHAKNMHLDVETDVLAESLGAAGYETRAFSANTNVTSHFDFDRGFDDFQTPDRFDHLNDDSLFDWREYSRTTETTGLRRYLRGVKRCFTGDVDTFRSIKSGIGLKLGSGKGVEYGGTKEAIAELGDWEFDGDEFLFLNLMEAHEPYRVPDEYASVPEPEMTDAVGDLSFGEANGEQVVSAYDDCARYLSDAYRELYEEVLSGFNYVITLSDHGELLGEYDSWGHEYGVYPELTHIPLVITGMEGQNRARDDIVSLIDVYETLLDMAGLEDTYSRGYSLFADVDRHRLTEYNGLTSWSEERLRDEYDEEIAGRYDQECRGIATAEGYRFETQERMRSMPGSLPSEGARADLEAFTEALEKREVSGQAEIPDDVQSQLKDLGYL